MFQKQLALVLKDLSKKDILIAEYFRNHEGEINQPTSYELAETLNIGQATIIRFSKKLGYNSYRELLQDLSTESVQTNHEITLNESTETTNHKIVEQYHEVITLTNAINDLKSIDDAYLALYHAQNIIVFGRGSSFLIAEYFANQLIKLGLNVFISSDYDITCTRITRTTSNDTCLLISDQGKSLDIQNLAKLVKEQSCKLITLTKANRNKLQDLGDITLKTVNYDPDSRLRAMVMRSSQLVVLDMLYLNIFKQDYDRFQKNINYSTQVKNK